MPKSFIGLTKIAQIPTVGDVMTRINADMTLDSFRKRQLLDSITRTGIPVSQPGNRLLYAGIGALAGNALSKYLGANPFWKGCATLGGALYGNHLYNKNNPDPHHKFGPGVYTW